MDLALQRGLDVTGWCQQAIWLVPHLRNFSTAPKTLRFWLFSADHNREFVE